MTAAGQAGCRSARRRGLSRWCTLIAFAGASLLAPSARATTLVCRNGDRLEGTVVSESDDEIVFDSVNFGTLRIQRAALAQTNSPPTRVDATSADATGVGAKRGKAAEAAPNGWKGRVALTVDRARSSGHQDSFALDLRLAREWARDEVRFESNYDFRRDDRRRNTDTLKTSSQWVRKVSDRYFGIYRAASEWNGSINYAGYDASYWLLQQELGGGVSFAAKNGGRLRVGASENFFNVWARPGQFSTAGNNEAVFAEINWPLPGETRLINRCVGYYSVKHGSAGIENTLELNHMISRTLSIGIKHDLREHVPDVRLQNNDNLRVLLGYEF